MRVLIVDDEAGIRRTVTRTLQRRCDDVQAVGSVAEAISKLESTEFDAIFCDLVMPDEPGTAVLEWLRAHRPASIDRLVFMTGGAAAELEATLSPARVVYKPLGRSELLDTLDSVSPGANAQNV